MSAQADAGAGGAALAAPAVPPAHIALEEVASHPSFRRLDSIAGIVFDLRYAGTHNFDGRVLYRGGFRSYDNRDGFYFDDERKDANDTSAHSVSSARLGTTRS